MVRDPNTRATKRYNGINLRCAIRFGLLQTLQNTQPLGQTGRTMDDKGLENVFRAAKFYSQFATMKKPFLRRLVRLEFVRWRIE